MYKHTQWHINEFYLTVFQDYMFIFIKAIPLQAWTVPAGSRRLRLPHFKKFGT